MPGWQQEGGSAGGVVCEQGRSCGTLVPPPFLPSLPSFSLLISFFLSFLLLLVYYYYYSCSPVTAVLQGVARFSFARFPPWIDISEERDLALTFPACATSVWRLSSPPKSVIGGVGCCLFIFPPLNMQALHTLLIKNISARNYLGSLLLFQMWNFKALFRSSKKEENK